MNAPSIIPGILDEYCWMHTPGDGGWTCEICWREIRLAAFFQATGEYASEQNYQEAKRRFAQQIIRRSEVKK